MTPATQPVETLLLATDFSECAGFALAWAQRLADRHGAKLVIHHALAPPQGAPTMPELVPYPPELHEQYRKAAMDRLEKAAQAAREDGLKAIVDLQVGPAVSTILMVAEKHDADAIVTGTRGLSGLRHVLLGSTAERLVQHSPIPVLSVHPDMQPPDKISRILVPTDFSDDDHEPLHASLRLMADEGTEIVLLHAFHIAKRRPRDHRGRSRRLCAPGHRDRSARTRRGPDRHGDPRPQLPAPHGARQHGRARGATRPLPGAHGAPQRRLSRVPRR